MKISKNTNLIITKFNKKKCLFAAVSLGRSSKARGRSLVTELEDSKQKCDAISPHLSCRMVDRAYDVASYQDSCEPA